MSPLMLTVLFNMFGEMLLSNSQGWLLQIKYHILKNIHIEQNRTECLYCHYVQSDIEHLLFSVNM